MLECPPRWHTLTGDVVAATHASSLQTGLGNAEAARRLVLVAAVVLAGFVGEPEETVAIAAIVVLNAILGFV